MRFSLFFGLLIFVFALYPTMVWLMQIATFTLCAVALSLDIRRRIPSILSLLLVFLFLSTLFSVNKIFSVHHLFSYIFVFFLATTLRTSDMQKIWNGLLFGTMLVGIVSLFYTLSIILFGSPPELLLPFVHETSFVFPYFGHAFYAVFLIAVFPFVMDKAIEKGFRFPWIVLVTFFALCLVLTFSKAAWVIGIAQMIAFIFIRRRHFVFPAAGIAAVGIGICILLFIAPKHPWVRDHIMKPSVVSRTEYMRQAIGIVRDAPVFRILMGYGPDTFYDLSHLYQVRPEYWSASSHNFFLQFLIENGAVATFLLILFIFYAVLHSYSLWTPVERITVFSLLSYSMIATVDLKTFPILFLFFLILCKGKRIRAVSIPWAYGILGVLILLFFVRYVAAFHQLFIAGKTSASLIAIFPYEPAFWKDLIISNRGNTEELNRLHASLVRFAPTDAELSRLYIKTLYDGGDVCASLTKSQQHLDKIPYDLAVQNIFIDSSKRCNQDHAVIADTFFQRLMPRIESSPESLDAMRPFLRQLIVAIHRQGVFCTSLRNAQKYLLLDPYDREVQDVLVDSSWRCNEDHTVSLDALFRKLKPGFDISSGLRDPMRTFLAFAAINYYRSGNDSDSADWFSKAWNMEVENTTGLWQEEFFNHSAAAFPVDKPFTIRMRLESGREFSGIGVHPRPYVTDLEWWKYPKLYVGLKEYGSVLNVFIYNGRSAEPIVLANVHTPRKIAFLELHVHTRGVQIDVMDEANRLMIHKDVTPSVTAYFPAGVFPEERVYFSYGVSSGSSLKIWEFQVLSDRSIP